MSHAMIGGTNEPEWRLDPSSFMQIDLKRRRDKFQFKQTGVECSHRLEENFIQASPTVSHTFH